MTLTATIVRKLADRGFLALDRMGVLDALDRTRHARSTVLMYHGILRAGPSRIGSPAIGRDSLADQVAYLKRHFSLIHPSEIWAPEHGADSEVRRRVALTFDDGFGNNATEAMPILAEMQAPALFFVSTRHVVAGQYLWFAHARALFMLYPGTRVELLQRSWQLGAKGHRERLFEEFVGLSRTVPLLTIYSELARYPVESFVPPEVIEEEMRGMSASELEAAAGNPLFQIGAHTRDHPLLTTCSNEELDAQLVNGRDDIERICGIRPLAFAYPEGDYDARVIERVKRAGFRTAFAAGLSGPTTPEPYAIPRVGVYSAAMGVLAAKARDWVRG